MNNPVPVSGWEHLDHDADIGIVGTGNNLESAFEQVALGMIAIVTDRAIARDVCVRSVCEAPDKELLLVDWLNELIYEMATRGILFGAFEVALDGNRLEARAWGERLDRTRHAPVVELKGATLTGLEVTRLEDGRWQARCVVDV